MPQESAEQQSIKPLDEQGTESKPTKKRTTRKKKSTTTKSKGLGDTIAKVTEATGIDKVVKAVVGDDCGCEKRRQELNERFPYAQEMDEEHQRVWETLVKPAWQRGTLRAKEQNAMRRIYKQVFGVERNFSQCPSCVLQALKKLEVAYIKACE